VRLRGTLLRVSAVRVRLLATGARPAVLRRALRPGAFVLSVPVPPGTRPGRIRIEISDATPPGGTSPAGTTVGVTVPAPREGVAARAWIAARFGGAPRPRLRPGLRLLVAHFRLAAPPARGLPLSIVWRRASSVALRQRVDPPEADLITAQIGSLAGGRIRPGAWRATLTAGGRPVATARVRLG
jgi:hypothetical protein